MLLCPNNTLQNRKWADVTKGIVHGFAFPDEGGRPSFDPLSHEGWPRSACTAAYNSSIFHDVLRKRVG